MNQSNQRNTRKTYGWNWNQSVPIITLLVILYLGISSLLFGIFSGTQTRNTLLQQYQLEQALAQVMTVLRFDSTMDLAETTGNLPFIVKGFGLYDSQGNSIFLRGRTPTTLDLSNMNQREQIITESPDGTILYIRRLPTFPGFRPGPQVDPPPDGFYTLGHSADNPGPTDYPQDRRFRGEPLEPTQDTELNQPPAAILIEVQQLTPVSGRLFSWPVYGFLVGLLAWGFFGFGRVYLKNLEYRRTLTDQENLVTLGEAARTISHEIKNPLSAIGLRIGILKHHTNPEAIEDLDIIQQEVDRLDRLVSKIGQFLKNPAGNPESIVLSDFLNHLDTRFPGQLRLETTTDVQEHLKVVIDPDHLRSIIENVLVNAKEAGAPEPLVISFEKRKHQILMIIADRGPGIDPSLGDSIFKPFVTTKTRGSGIGLAIARRFAEAAGGSLHYKPNPLGGTLMILSLPEAP
jgi:two-component system sensor histidine kinase HydH